MPKGGGRGKSSASSATRKKQATKAAKKLAGERDDDGNLLHPEAFEALQKQGQPLQRGQKKDKAKDKDTKGKVKGKKVQRKKQFIPPPKPPQPLPDPLDSMGLASLLPADLVVLLRKASKKDVVTRCRALEGLLAWIEDALEVSSASGTADHPEDISGLTNGEKREALVMMLPCWVHLFPRLALSPTRRLRLLTSQIQALLLQEAPASPDSPAASTSSTRTELLQSPSYIESMLGPWAILSHDTDRAIERIGKATWVKSVTWPSSVGDESLEPGSDDRLSLNEHIDDLIEHLKTLLLSPSPSSALALTAAHAPAAPSGPLSAPGSGVDTPVTPGVRDRDAKNRDDANVEEDTAALDKRLVAGALSVLSFIVTVHPGPKPDEALDSLLSSKLLWSSLSPSNILATRTTPERGGATSSFGFDAPAVRARGWVLLRDLQRTMTDVLDRHVTVYGTVAMSAAWQERDVAVQRAMLDALLPILKARPSMWMLDAAKQQTQGTEDHDDEVDSDDDSDESGGEDNAGGDDDDEQEDEAASRGSSSAFGHPRSYFDFMQWLQVGCGGSPTLGYPTVLVFLSTLPKEAFDATALDQSSDFLTTQYSALFSRELDSDPAGSRAFLASFCECTVYLCSRLFRDAPNAHAHAQAAQLAQRHLGLVWRELVLAVPPSSDHPDDGQDRAEAVESEAELRARTARIKSMGDSRISAELIGSIRKLYNIDQEGHVGAQTIGTIRSDLVAVAEHASLASIDPSLSVSTSGDVQASLGRATGILAGLLLPSATNSNAARASQIRAVAGDLVLELLTVTAGFFNQNAAVARTDALDSTVKLDIQAILMSMLVRALSSAGVVIDQAALTALELVASQSLPQLTVQRGITPSVASLFLAAYLPVCPDQDVRAKIWSQVLGSVSKLSSVADQVEVLDELVIAAGPVEQDASIATLSEGEAPFGLEETAIALTTRICDADTDQSFSTTKAKHVVSKLLSHPRPFIDVSVADQMLAIVTSTIEHLRYLAVDHGPSSADSNRSATERKRAAKVLPDLLDCLAAWFSKGDQADNLRRLATSSASSGVISAVFDLSFFAVASSSTSTSVQAAVQSTANASFQSSKAKAYELWVLITAQPVDELREELLRTALTSLNDQLLDTKVPVDLLVSASKRLSIQLGLTDATLLLPSENDFDAMLVRSARLGPSPLLSTLDPTVPQTEPEDSADPFTPDYDAQGYGPYTRAAVTSVSLLKSDRDLARHKQQLLPHMVFLALLAEDELLQPGSSKHAFAASTVRATLTNMVQDAIGVATGLLSSLAAEMDGGWHAELVASLQKGETIAQSGLRQVLTRVWSLARAHPESSHLGRLFGRLLSGCLSYGSVSSADGERWLKMGRSAADAAPFLGQAVIVAIKPYVQEAQAYDRVRNELAANLAGVAPSKASTQGLSLLRLAIAAAPDIDSDMPMLPQQRAIFLLQTLQKWIASDDDIPEEINVRLAQLFVLLIPIVQDMPGSHVDFFFDLVESNLDVASLSDAASLPGLYFTLRLLETLRDFALRNANLREIWTERKDACLELVRDLFISLADETWDNDSPEQTASTPREVCAELIVDLVREVPSKSFDVDATAGPLCKLITSSQVHDVQVVSYRLLSASIKDRVKELVVETAVDKALLAEPENRSKLSFPSALLDNVADPLDGKLGALVDDEAARRVGFGYFLSWIAIFDHFEDASLQLKSLFVAELEKRGLVSASLLPSVFALTGLVNEDRRPFDPARWVVDEVFLDLVDPSPVAVIQVLATHVYFRALIQVPTMVRNWWLDIKDRQLSMLVTSFTSRHCTPLIAARELSHLREPDALARLQDEALSIKVLATNEVVATYTVDEHPMEIGVRIPPDFPLHGVEIRDIRRVGVSEAQWRAWLLAVQQLITGQNGLIFDALSLFKRNAEVQFQGLEECAICYSIISPMDRSLPTKPCKTCKNKFHAGCLFKWISTSGSSTCPLCRSIL